MPAPIDRLAQLFAGEGVQSYLGEQVSLATHMLQAAALAEGAGATDHLVAAALLHDVGHFEALGRRGAGSVDHRHEATGAAWLAQWFPQQVTEPVRLHVMAKRYLCTIEPGYASSLSLASVQTLRLQGGPLSVEEARVFERMPYVQDAIAVRRWDEAAKNPSVVPPPFDHFDPF